MALSTSLRHLPAAVLAIVLPAAICLPILASLPGPVARTAHTPAAAGTVLVVAAPRLPVMM